MRIRIVVANQSEARFFDSFSRAQTLMPAGVLLNPVARLHDRDLDADRPGRVFNGGLRAGGRRGATARHATDSDRSTRQHRIELFARRIGAELERARAAHRFERIVLVADPAFLGRLRRTLPPALRACIAATVTRDLINQPDSDVRDYLPYAVFQGTTGFQPAMRVTARSYT